MTNVRDKFEIKSNFCLFESLFKKNGNLALFSRNILLGENAKPQRMNDCGKALLLFFIACKAFHIAQCGLSDNNFKRLIWLLMQYLWSRFYVASFDCLCVVVFHRLGNVN